MTTTITQQVAQASLSKPKGYPRLARLMGRSNDVAIFRKYDEFNMLNLLSLQAELAALRKEYWDQCRVDDTCGPPYDTYTENFQTLRHSEGTATGEQYSILLKIRTKMKEYSK
jgi:hypothetical protein